MPTDLPPWLTIARSYLGTDEVPGPKSNPTILQWAKNMGGWVAGFFRDDATPWCSLFVNAVMQEAGFPLSGPDGSATLLRARSFATYGTPLEVPTLGAILVFERPGGAHVGFYMGETLKAYQVCGGNQSNTVADSWLPTNRCIAIRWPPGLHPPTSGRRWLRPTGEPMSLNEQ